MAKSCAHLRRETGPEESQLTIRAQTLAIGQLEKVRPRCTPCPKFPERERSGVSLAGGGADGGRLGGALGGPEAGVAFVACASCCCKAAVVSLWRSSCWASFARRAVKFRSAWAREASICDCVADTNADSHSGSSEVARPLRAIRSG